MAYAPRSIGAKYTLEYACYIQDASGKVVSPFHDIPLFADEAKGILNMVVEIPRWTNAKLEVSKTKEFNPIVQDTKKGKLRFVKNCFPHHGYIWNYGCFPQTWEDPTVKDPDTDCFGDNDPLDVCEIGSAVAQTGEVKQVKVLGVMAMLDEGETDYKVLVIDVNDPLASEMNDVEDIEKKMPGFIRATEEWFRIYKMPDGKPENKFAWNGEARNKAQAMKIIKECQAAWQKLIKQEIPNKSDKYDISCTNSTVDGPYKNVDAAGAIPAHQDVAPAPLDSSVNIWHFVATL